MLMIERDNNSADNGTTRHSGRASSEIPEWLQEFRENLVDDEVPERGDSHVSFFFLESTFKKPEELGKHSVFSFTRVPCRRRNGGA